MFRLRFSPLSLAAFAIAVIGAVEAPSPALAASPLVESALRVVGIGDPVDLWSFEVKVAPGQCVTEMEYLWPNMRHITVTGAGPKQKCGSRTRSISANHPITTEPLNVKWVDGQGARHDVTFDVHALLKGKTLYGGTLTLEFFDDSADLYLSEPDKSRCSGRVCARKPPVMLDSKQ